jgi:hypothetical protein
VSTCNQGEQFQLAVWEPTLEEPYEFTDATDVLLNLFLNYAYNEHEYYLYRDRLYFWEWTVMQGTWSVEALSFTTPI